MSNRIVSAMIVITAVSFLIAVNLIIWITIVRTVSGN